MTDIQMEPNLRHGIQQLCELTRGVEIAWKVFDHQTDAVLLGRGKQFMQRC
jgi:hypothetical protein